MKKIIGIIILPLLFLNIFGNNKDTLLILSGGDRIYWDRTDGVEGYVFYKDSTVKEYDGKRHIYFTCPQDVFIKKYEVKNDTIKIYYGIKYKYILYVFRIEKITKDTLILRRGDVTFVYVKSKDQKTEARFGTSDDIKIRIRGQKTKR
jgi:hypothetical protein